MATRKVTVTIEVAQLERIRALVEHAQAPSVSGFVQHAVGIALDDLSGWEALLDAGLAATGGGLTDDERTWADRILGAESAGLGTSAA